MTTLPAPARARLCRHLRIPALVAVFMLAVPAGAAVAAVHGSPAASSARFVSDQLYSDSCTPLHDGSAAHFGCLAVGYFVHSGTLQPLGLAWHEGGTWGRTAAIPDPPRNNKVNLPDEISCVAPDQRVPTCVMVGQHYTDPRKAAPLAATWHGAWKPVSVASPRGATWSALFDVSCQSPAFCMLVGAAGTTRTIGHGFAVVTKATAYIWNGSHATRLTVPGPRGARTSELGGVSCPSATSCTAVGDYTTAAGRTSTYAIQWDGGQWQLQTTRNARGARVTTFEAVSCPSTTECVAVGQASQGRGGLVAELWSKGKWRLSLLPDGNAGGLFGVSCLSVSSCYAAGQKLTRGVIEHWVNGRWFPIRLRAAAAPLRATVLTHVSCAGPASAWR